MNNTLYNINNSKVTKNGLPKKKYLIYQQMKNVKNY